MDITSLLTFASQSGASDVHLSSGEPPMIRLHGDMKKLDHPRTVTRTSSLDDL